MRLIQNALIRMDDGVQIAADIYLPDEEGRYPAVFYFGPYRKDDYIVQAGSVCGLPVKYTTRGYALVVADVRGTNDSGGIAREAFDQREQRDGYNLVEWIAVQPWCDGNVGMTGISYGFFTSLLTAAQRPPHLRTVVPIHGGTTWYYCLNEGGLPMWFGYHGNYVALMISMLGSPPGYRDPQGHWRELWKNRRENFIPWGLEWFDHPSEDEYYDMGSVRNVYERIEIPVFAIDGWWDRYSDAPFEICEEIKSFTKILVGPWQHSRLDTGFPGPRVDYEVILRWFDYWLKGERNGILDEPRVTVFAQRYGSPADYRSIIPGDWRHENAWPIELTRSVRWYLHGGGVLDQALPRESGSCTYQYDPSAGLCSGLSGGIYGPIGMPVDQRPEEAKSVISTTGPLAEEIEVIGTPRVRLHFTSSAPLMGVIAKLCDVAPDGTVALVTRGYLNAAHRESSRQPNLLDPGTSYPLEIIMKGTAYVFEPGHRIRLAITSAEFPTFLPTPEPGINRIDFGGERSSYLDLPLAPAASHFDHPASLKILPPPPEQPPTDRRYTISHKFDTGEYEAGFEVCEKFAGLEGSIEHRQRTSACVRPDQPAEAVLESSSTFTFNYTSGEKIVSVGSVRYRTHQQSIDVDAELNITINGAVESHRNWSASYSRRFI